MEVETSNRAYHRLNLGRLAGGGSFDLRFAASHAKAETRF